MPEPSARPLPTVTVIIPRELHSRLKAQAALSGKTLYDYITSVLEDHLRVEEGKSGTGRREL